MMKRQNFLENGARMRPAIAMAAGLLAGLAGPAAAQSFPIDPAAPDPVAEESADTQGEGLEDVGRTAETGIGEIGERAEFIVNTDPMARLDTRIHNRLQNRIRSRIDRDYDPMANATSPFEEVDQQTRKGLPR